jgi:putative ABC transport system permease protein
MVVPEGYEDKARAALISGKPSVFYMPSDTVERIKKIRGIKKVTPQLFMKSTSHPCCSYMDVLLVAFEPNTDFTIGPWLQSEMKKNLTKEEAIVGSSIPVNIGEKIAFFGKEFRVVGFLQKTGLEYIDYTVYITIEAAMDLIEISKTKAYEPLNIPKNVYSTIFVQLDEKVSPERAAIFIEHDINGVKAITYQNTVGALKRQLLELMKIFLVFGISLVVVTISLISIVFSMIINERKREIGIFRYLGAKRSSLLNLIAIEAFIISVIGGITGIVVGSVFLLFIKKSIIGTFNLSFLWPGTLFMLVTGLIVLLISITIGIVSALYSIIRIKRMTPYEAIRIGE